MKIPVEKLWRVKYHSVRKELAQNLKVFSSFITLKAISHYRFQKPSPQKSSKDPQEKIHAEMQAVSPKIYKNGTPPQTLNFHRFRLIIKTQTMKVP